MTLASQLSFDFSETNSTNQEISSKNLVSLPDFETIPNSVDLALLGYELKLTHAYDKLSALSNSRTRLLPHQIESTYIVVNSLKPRFILADEVGLGKTIEASLIMKELLFRRGYKKVLIVAPSPLLVQWQQELKNKFNEEFYIIKKKNFQEGYEYHWKKYDKVITSIDFIKNPHYSDEILKTKWDIVIFDEAHRLRRDYSKITRAYVFAEKIAKKCDCLLLLTATPFRGKLEELYYLLHLIDPNILGPYHTFINDYVVGNRTDLKEKISKVLLRRRKVEVGGFTKRFAKTVKIDLSPIERQFYDETTDYVKREFNLAMGTKNRAIGFVMIVFQKLLDSSVVALQSALIKRKFMLETRFHAMKELAPELDDWNLDETEGVEDFINELEEGTYSDFQNLKRELFTLNRLIHLGKQIKEDRKSLKLKETLIRLKKEGTKKFIIFTQFRSTQDYLVEVLKDFKVVSFHGSLSAEQKEDAILEFKNSAEILICTEAGGEGRNLQFANILFNYDLPWSPLKIEQRIGRIHRFGQKDNVYIFNFASKDTVAERILEVLTNKIQLFENSIGASDDLLGTIEEELDFNSSLMKFVTGQKSKEELETELDIRVEIAKKGFDKLNGLVTPKLIDFNLKDYYDHTLEERKFKNNHLEEFVSKFEISFPNKLTYHIQKDFNSDSIYTVNYGNSKFKKATFDSDIALADDSLEFLAFGHPIVDNCFQHVIENKESIKSKIISNPQYRNKIYFIFLVDYLFSLQRSELSYLCYARDTGKIENLDEFPNECRNLPHNFDLENMNWNELFQSSIGNTYQYLQEAIDLRKQKLGDETNPIFLKEEYKIQVSHQKNIRQMEEKLMRQEASFKWEGKPENKSILNRTKNEILRAKEEYERELQKVRSGSRIQHRIKLLQVYFIV
jgi:superfamily II DNA or RNA helicase